MSVHSDRALVLARHPYGESSLVVHVWTRESGRVDLLAKGAYRPTSRYFAVLDYFDTLDLEWSHSGHGELGLLRRGALHVRRATIAADLRRYRAGLCVLELIELVARPAAGDPALFARTELALDELAEGRLQPELVQVAWELALLEALGLAPALDRCAACGRRPAQPGHPGRPFGRDARVAFSAGAGGRLCADCGREARASGRRVGTLPVSVLDEAELLWHDPARGSELAPGRLERVRDFVERFVDYHLETRPRSHRAFLAAPNRNAPPQPLPPAR